MATRKNHLVKYEGNVRNYKGYQLVETGHRYYSACKGSARIPVGSVRRGDFNDLCRRFMAVIDELEAQA